MKIKKFSNKPSDINDRIGAKPVVCYPNNIEENDSIYSDDFKLEKFKSYLSFVAIKNGEHNGTRYKWFYRNFIRTS